MRKLFKNIPRLRMLEVPILQTWGKLKVCSVTLKPHVTLPKLILIHWNENNLTLFLFKIFLRVLGERQLLLFLISDAQGSSHSRDYDSYGGRYGESSSNDRMVFREERRSLRGDRRSSEYPVHRKSGPPSHTETSPRFTSPRGGRGSRGSYRGRSSSFRGSVRPSYTKPISTPRSSSTVMRRYRPEYSTRGRSALLKKRKELEIIQKYKR